MTEPNIDDAIRILQESSRRTVEYINELQAENDRLRRALQDHHEKPCNKSCAPGYCYCECPHGVTDGNCKECYEAKATVPSDCPDGHQPVAWYHVPYPGSGISPVVSMFQQREPSLYGAVVPLYTALQRCPNCASLEAQNTELDRKLADLEQTSLELCKACGWRTLIPAEGCLNCARSKQTELERSPLTDEEIGKVAAPYYGTMGFRVEAFARAIEWAHGIGDSK